MSRQGTSLPSARWSRRLSGTAAAAVVALVGQFCAGTSAVLAAPATAAASRQSGHPNLPNVTAGDHSINHLPAPPKPGNAPPLPFTPPRQVAVPMQPALVPLDPVAGAHFLGSDGVLEVSAAAGAVTAADVAGAGGKMSLLVRQVLPASGSNAGGSGHYSFGTWLVQVVDAAGRPAARGLRQPLSMRLHQDRRAGALDLKHVTVTVNPALPSWVDLRPSSTPVRMADGAALAAPSVKPSLGPTSRRAASLDASTTTLSATLQADSPSTAASFDTFAPVATFGRPDPVETDLSAGALTMGEQLDLPAGPGGLTPPLQLSYNSAAVSDQHNPQAAAGWVGEGWNLGLGSISWAEHNVETVCATCNNPPLWEDSWQLSDPYGTAADLVPPNVNVTTYLDDSAAGVKVSSDAFVTASGVVYARDVNGGLEQFVPHQGAWQAWNMSAQAQVTVVGTPFASTSGAVWAEDSSGHLREFLQGSNGNWTAWDVSAQANVAIAGDPFITTSGGVDNAWARDTNGHLRQFAPGSGGSWTAYDLTGSNNPAIQGRPFVSGSGSVWAEDSTGHLRQFTPGSGGSWTAYDISNSAQVAIANDPFVTTSGGVDNAWARDTNGHLRQFAPGSGGSWTAYDLTGSNNPAIQGRPFVSGSGSVWADDSTGHLRQFTPGSGGSWTAYDISNLAGGVSVFGSPFVTSSGVQDTAWIGDTSGQLRQFVNTGSWVDYSVSGQSNRMTPTPVIWHTAPENRARVVEISSGITLPGGVSAQAPCFRVFLPNGIMEEFGCTANSIQYYPSSSTGNAGLPFIANWLLDMITDPQGNQVHVTYQSDSVALSTMTYSRDMEPLTVEYDSPSCHDAQVMCTGSAWAPLMRVNFVAGHTVAHGTGCAANGTLRCDDPADLSQSGGVAAPLIENTFVLDDVQIQVRASGSAGWNTLRDYQLSYAQAAASTNPIVDPFSGDSESIAGHLVLTGLQEIGADGATTMPARSYSYFGGYFTEYYEDSLGLPKSGAGCGPTWNNGITPKSPSGPCVLWSQSYDSNSYYMTSFNNGLGLLEQFSWLLARANAHGVNGGGSNNANPYGCNPASFQTTYPCNMPDDESWSRMVLSSRSDQVVQVTQNGQGGARTNTTVTGTWNYGYQLAYPLVSPECASCVASFYWGNQNDFDMQDFYNVRFMGFAQTSVGNPDGSLDVHKFHTTEGIGLYDMSQVSCDPLDKNHPCTPHNDPWSDINNVAHGHEYELDRYATDGQTLLQQVKTKWTAACPAPGVSGSPPDPVHGNWDGNLVSPLDRSNPVMVCEVHPVQTDQLTYDGTGTGPVPDHMTTYTYDNLGRVSSQSSLNTTGIFDLTTFKGHGTWSGGVGFGVPGLVGDGDTAMSFDGSSGEVDTGYLENAVTAYSVEAWIQTTSGGSHQTIVQDRGTGGGQSLTLGLSPSGGGAGDP